MRRGTTASDTGSYERTSTSILWLTIFPIFSWVPSASVTRVLYEKQPYALPISLEIGDRVLIEGTGAYTATYSSVAFNGFTPLKTYHI